MQATERAVPTDATPPGPTLATGPAPWQGSVGAALTDSARAAPVAEVVPWADGAALMVAAQVALAPACLAMDRGSLSRVLHVAIGVKQVESEAAASTRTTRVVPEAAAPMSWDGRSVDGHLGSTAWAGSESMAAACSRTAAVMTQMGGTGEVRRGEP
jgi:hypothetical protein